MRVGVKVLKEKNITRTSELSMFIVVVIWGLGFPITRYAITEAGYSVNMVNTGRFLTGSIILSILFYKKLFEIDKNTLIYGSIVGVLMFISFHFQTLGAAHTTAAKNGFITQMNIIIIPVLYLIFFKTMVKKKMLFAIPVSVFGLLVLSYEDGGLSGFQLGDFYTLICAVAFAFYMVLTSLYQKEHSLDPVAFSIVTMYTVAILGSIITIASSEPVSFEGKPLWPFLFLGVLNTAFCFTVQSVALKHSNVTKISIIVTLEAVFGAIGGAVFLGESLTPQVIVGGFMILFAVFIAEFDFKGQTEEDKIKT